MSESFWQKDSQVTHIFLIYAYLNILAQSQILGNSLYSWLENLIEMRYAIGQILFHQIYR